MIDPLTRMCRQIIKVRFDKGFNIMKGKIHCPLKGIPNIFQSKGNFLVREGTPRTNESCFMLVFRFNLNLIISRETIHKRKEFTPRASINNLVYKWRGIVVLRKDLFKSMKSVQTRMVPCFLSTGTYAFVLTLEI